MNKKFFLFLGLFISILLFVFRNIAFNINTHLLDWLDYPFIIWVISQSADHIIRLDFTNLFESNAFYPHKLTLLFSDLLIPQALMILPFLLITKNLILSFNIIFLLTFILNFISLFLFWRQIFKKDLTAFFGSIFVIFSPFFYMELSHFQIMSYWPFFFASYYLFKNEEKPATKNLLMIGLLITIQFLASVYLSIYLLASVIIFFLLKFIDRKKLLSNIYNFLLILMIFGITCGIFIKGYIDMKNTYNVKRNIEETINYSANLSDYIFTSEIKSLAHQSSIMQIWNKLDKNKSSQSSFPGFLVFILALFGLFKILRERDTISLLIKLNREKSFFLILILLGLFFSLGPRLKFNGNYAHIPLPYDLMLRMIPSAAEATRAPVRWSFLFFLGVIYFSLIPLNKLGNKKTHRLIFSLVFIIFVLEYLPFNIKSEKYSYISNDYSNLKNVCSENKKVLLELPLTHFDAYPNIYEGLKYVTVMELSSTHHKCLLVNGYSGYDLPENLKLSALLSKYIENEEVEDFTNFLREYNIDYVKFNQYHFIKELKPHIGTFVDQFYKQDGIEKISNDLFYVDR